VFACSKPHAKAAKAAKEDRRIFRSDPILMRESRTTDVLKTTFAF